MTREPKLANLVIMKMVTVHQAKTNLSELIRRAEAGEEIVIARGDKPVAVLRDYDGNERHKRRLAGQDMFKGKHSAPPNNVFFGPASHEDNVEMFGAEFADLMLETGAESK